jgi:glyoxylase-like metal-dependent hydrolase (beta-lactamase superfamily II)
MKEFLIPISDSMPNIFFVAGENEAKYPYSNSLVIGNTLIDTGIPKRVLRTLSKDSIIQQVILSHWHEDHLSGNQYIMRSPDTIHEQIRFFCHKDDQSTIENVGKMFDLYGINGSAIENEFKAYFDMFSLKNMTNTHVLLDNDIIQADFDYKLTVIHTPGHSAGHICLYEPNIKLMFVGDIDLSAFGPWYGCLDGDVEQFEQSIDKLMKFDIEYAVSSHKGVIVGKEIITQKLLDYKRALHQREETLLKWIKERKIATIGDLSNRNLVYNKYTQFPEYLQLAERIMIEKHIESMLNKKLIIKNQNGFMLNSTLN